jgi:translation initiation factor 2B subunit (eIF-2B alpha/beta/delta family)
LISDTEDEVILTYGGPEMELLFIEALKNKKKFELIIADSGPDYESRPMV